MTPNRIQRLRFACDRFGLALRIAQRRIMRRLVKHGVRCPECRGKGFVANCELTEFIEEVGLPVYYAATMLADREDQLGNGKRFPDSSWEGIGLTGYSLRFFVDDLRYAWPIWECSLCSTASHADITERAFEKTQRAAAAFDQPST